MKRIKNIKNYKVNIEVKRSDSTTGENYEKESKEFFFMTKKEAEQKIVSCIKNYEEEKWEINKKPYGFEAFYKNKYTKDQAIATMEEVNLIGIVKYKIVFSGNYNFAWYPSTIKVFDSIEEAKECFDILIKKAKEICNDRKDIKEDTTFAFKAEARGDNISITLEKFVEQYVPTKIYEVVGINDLEGMIFAVCTSVDKAIEAEKLLKAQGFEDIEIKKSNLNLDEIKIGQYIISL